MQAHLLRFIHFIISVRCFYIEGTAPVTADSEYKKALNKKHADLADERFKKSKKIKLEVVLLGFKLQRG